MMEKLAVPIASLALAVVTSLDANADCDVPAIYELMSADGSTVVICMSSSRGGCPHDAGMLRENVETGEAVLLHDDCAPKEGDWGTYSNGSCYIDECVPSGYYRYGYADAQCVEYACHTDYYGMIGVAALPGCTRIEGTTPPAPWDSPVPWGNEQRMCDYVPWYPPEPYLDVVEPYADVVDASADSMTDTASWDAPTADTEVEEGSASEAASCGCSIPRRGTEVVLLANFMVLLAGVVLLIVRRGRR